MKKQVKTVFVSDSGKEYSNPVESYLNDMYLFAGKHTTGLSEQNIPDVLKTIKEKYEQLQEYINSENNNSKFKELH